MIAAIDTIYHPGVSEAHNLLFQVSYFKKSSLSNVAMVKANESSAHINDQLLSLIF